MQFDLMGGIRRRRQIAIIATIKHIVPFVSDYPNRRADIPPLRLCQGSHYFTPPFLRA